MQAAKKRSNSKVKMADYQKRARRGMMGFTISWFDKDPFSETAEISGGEVTHSNPTQRLICRDMWRRCSQWIVTTEFRWCITMLIVYETERRGDKIDEYEFEGLYTLRGNKSDQVNEIMQGALAESIQANDSLPDGHKNKGSYKQCEFIAKVVGV